MQVAVVHEDPVLETAVGVVDSKVAKENATIQHLGLLKNRTPLKPTKLHHSFAKNLQKPEIRSNHLPRLKTFMPLNHPKSAL